MSMSESTKKLKAIEIALHELCDNAFGLKDWNFVGEMKNGNLMIAVMGFESKHAKKKRPGAKQTSEQRHETIGANVELQISAWKSEGEGVPVSSASEEETGTSQES